MSTFSYASGGADIFLHSRSLQRSLSALTNFAYVRFDAHHTNLCLKTRPSQKGVMARCDLPTGKLRAMLKPSEIREIVEQDINTGAGDWTRSFSGSGNWALFCCRYKNGTEDLIAMRLDGGAHDAHCRDVLAAIWPMFREDSIQELIGGVGQAITSALLWTISNKSDSAVLVLDESGTILHFNAAAGDVLKEGHVIRDAGGQLRCASDASEKALHHALRTCVASGSDKENEEFILFVESTNSTGRLPLSLSVYNCAAHNAPLIIAILPCQPDIKRIEMLAQKMGLSPAESRVAALMQLGLPNRKAASLAGVKEQTFNTYAKRVLSKLEMSCRAEMAHNLTWQASVGRAS